MPRSQFSTSSAFWSGGNTGGPCNFGSGLATNVPLAVTDQNGYRTLSNVCVPANWNLARHQSSSCPVPALNFSFRVDNGLTYTLPCNGQPAFTATPSSIGVHSPPSTITFSGDPLASSAYGLPRIDFYDVNGSGIGSVTAASMAGDGSSVTAATPGFLLTQYTTGTYFAIINNMNADGTASPAAAAGLYLYANDGVTVAGVSIIGPTYLNAGDNVQYQAIATLTNGSIREVTSEAVWDSSDPQSAYITNPGLVSAPYGWGGMPTLSASYEGVTGTLEVSVGSV